jgi:Ser/Thr protein kinase RdoA (MazF antagonist)
MAKRFPDPDLPEHVDIRTLENARVVPDEVIDSYGLNNAVISAIDTGSYNIHFKIESEGKRFDLRKSNRPSQIGNHDYESEILNHLRSQGFTLAPEVVPSVSGDFNLWVDDTGWTLFKWMGSDSGPQRELANRSRALAAAKTLADIHRMCKDFHPAAQRAKWPIFTVPTVNPATWLKRAESLADELKEEGEDLRRMSRQSAGELEQIDFDKLPEYMCHADYRMRNLQFEGDEITGVFDFDTSIRTTRLFDLAGAVTRFSPLGGDPLADVEAGSTFLEKYHEQLPLSSYEIDALPALIRWRLLREVVVYYDTWWFDVRSACTDLFSGAAEKIVNQLRPV